MQKNQIKPGLQYAIRETTDGPLQRVKILEHIRAGHWRAEWIEPNRGLVHFVKSSQVVATWRSHRAFLREEADKAELHAHNQRVGHREPSALDTAVSSVFEAAGDEVSYFRGTLTGSPDAIDRIRTRAGVPTGQMPRGAYVDRAGTLHLPYDAALELAKKFAGTEPITVLSDIETTERKWARDLTVPGEEHMAGLLNEYRAAWAVVRQWTGTDPAIAQREATIQRLERLVWDAVYALQKAGCDHEARRLRRALGRE